MSVPYGDIENFRWKLTEDEKTRLIRKCPKCGSENLDPAGGWNSANGWVKCYDCGHGPFWWLRTSTTLGGSISGGERTE